MRNLKKILSLALALVMVMSLLTVASAKDFNDADQIEHTEAVEVMSALGVINGRGNNTFDPKGNVTRGEMAKMITYISLGNVEPTAFLGTTVNLTDINGHWAEAYIKYCYSQGIISGRGNGIFDPNASVTATEAARMLLVAIGYNANVQIYTGSSWAINVVRDAQLSHLYDEVSVTSDEVLTRDKAAQMMYNALLTETIEKSSSVDRVTGDITDIYTANGDPLLYKSYGARVAVATFAGNNKFRAAGAPLTGEIVLTNGTTEDVTLAGGAPVTFTTANIPFDFDIANIGEEVKVIFKDGSIGTKDVPDRNDTIYGVYVTGGTTVYNITRADLQDAKTDAAWTSASSRPKIKFNNNLYEVALTYSSGTPTGNRVDVYLNYTATAGIYTASQINGGHASSGNTANDGAINVATPTALRGQSVDAIKFVTNDEGRISTAYVTEYKIARVSGVTSDKITIEGVGSINIADNDVYSGAAVDDVVVYTRYYDNSDKDNAYFTVKLAETVDGVITGYKGTSPSFDNVVVDGTTYKINGKKLTKASSDEIINFTSNDIDDTVRLYMINGMVGAIQKTEEKGGKFALVTGVSSGGTIGSAVDPVRVEVMLADGTKQILNVHKDSTSNGTAALGSISSGDLIEYSSIADGSIKIYKVAAAHGVVTNMDSSRIWNKDTKKLVYDNYSHQAVAASNAVLFVLTDTGVGGTNNHTIDSNENVYAYNLRDMSDIAWTSNVHVAYILNDDGLVAAAYAILGVRPSSSTANTLYGVVKDSLGVRVIDGTTYNAYDVAVNNGERKEILVDANTGSLSNGWLISFDETSDNCYNYSAFTQVLSADDTANGGSNWVLAAVDTYSNNTLTYYTATRWDAVTQTFVGAGTKQSITVKSDVKVIYVNGKDRVTEENSGIPGFNSNNGYANVTFHTDSGVVDVVIVEVTGEANMAVKGSSKENATTMCGTPETVSGATLSAGAVAGSLNATVAGTATVTLTAGAALPNGTPISVTWYNSAGTDIASAPAGITMPTTANFNDGTSATMTITAGTGTVAGTYYFKVNGAGATTGVVTLTVNPAPITYTVSAPTVSGSEAGGAGKYTAAVDVTSAAAGDTVTVTVTRQGAAPSTGADEITVTTTKGGTVTGSPVTLSSGTGTATFTMPAANVDDITVTVTHAYAVSAPTVSGSETNGAGKYTAAVDVENAKAGATVTVTVTQDNPPGTGTDTITVTTTEGGTVSNGGVVTIASGTGSVTFTMPSKDVDDIAVAISHTA